MDALQQIPLASIDISGGTQSRFEINTDIVSEYAIAMGAGEAFPAVVLFYDGSKYWLADGFHRFHAAAKTGFLKIDGDVRTGTCRDAVLFSVGANAAHGLRRSNDDKRRAVETLLADADWAAWSDRQIAKACGVSQPFVGAVRSPAVAVRQQANRDKARASAEGEVKSDFTCQAASQIAKDRQPSAARDIPLEDESAEEISARTDATAMKPPAGLVTEQEDDEFLAEMNSLRDMNTDLHREIDSLTATDTGLEIHRLMQLLLHTENALKECREHAAVREKALKWFGKQYVELRTLLDVKEDRGVVAAVKLLKASAK